MSAAAAVPASRRFLYRVDGGEDAPRRARALVAASVNGASCDTAFLDNLLLAVSEVVTNSVVHGGAGEGGVIELALAFDGPSVRVEVSDDGPGFPASSDIPRPEPTTGGMGLGLVQAVSDRWGIDNGALTSVWFECSSSPGAIR